MILGIETSCDECSASVVTHIPGQDRVRVLSLATFSQTEIHKPFGGVVPEVASRNHLETINLMIQTALDDAKVKPKQLECIAVTNRPGLVGALLVGLSAGKALAYACNKPLVPVHHLEGHAVSVFLTDQSDSQPEGSSEAENLEYPLLLAIVSGGHTNLYRVEKSPQFWTPDFLKSSLVGRSRDDAAGEAFDKTAKKLGFPYPGGIWIDKSSKGGKVDAFHFPRALGQKSILDFSFSGLKTAVSLKVDELKSSGQLKEKIPDLCASIQEAIVDALLNKIYLAVQKYECRSLVIVGGVAANSRLRFRLASEWQRQGLARPPVFPQMEYCTDNAAMIAAAGAFRFRQGNFLEPLKMLSLNALASAEV
ncbi:MAG: tRNA (adenosine(37)-N6)-threonylcarbamoyltransferase complex transferase subunit TsaD [Bdellovibrio sp.]|nr:tRNA (adenosine(37)-N6)-threonylcarbamoyltransferase complex transferase subunit TsaD [Bdellovibrio sp.]